MVAPVWTGLLDWSRRQRSRGASSLSDSELISSSDMWSGVRTDLFWSFLDRFSGAAASSLSSSSASSDKEPEHRTELGVGEKIKMRLFIDFTLHQSSIDVYVTIVNFTYLLCFCVLLSCCLVHRFLNNLSGSVTGLLPVVVQSDW